MPYCQQFKTQIAQWEKELSEARLLLVEYLESGEEEKVGEVREQLEKLSNEQKNFLEGEYREQVIKMLKNGILKDKKIENAMKQVEFTEDGRVIIKEDLYLGGSPSLKYFPTIIKKIEGSLSLRETKVANLDFLEEVVQDIGLEAKIPNVRNRLLDLAESCCFRSARRLRKVGGDMNLTCSDVQSLESLEKVGGYLVLKLTPFKLAPKLKEIGEWLDLTTREKVDSFKKSFPELKKIGIDSDGFSISLTADNIPVKNAHLLAAEIEKLKEEGSISCDRIRV